MDFGRSIFFFVVFLWSFSRPLLGSKRVGGWGFLLELKKYELFVPFSCLCVEASKAANPTKK
jgi:hypothetical protein